MNLLRSQLYLLGIIWMFPSVSDLKKLDNYCSEQVGGHFDDIIPEKIRKYIRICRNAQKYLMCMMESKAMVSPPADVVIEPYEKYFPKMEDLKRATLHFCSFSVRDLMTLVAHKNEMCDDVVDISKCYKQFIRKGIMEELNETMNDEELDEFAIREISCSIVSHLTNCIYAAYVDCNSDYTVVRNYELMSYGRECLLTEELTMTLTMFTNCLSSRGVPSAFPRITVLVLGNVLAVSSIKWDWL